MAFLDETDRRILRILQTEARISNAELARQVDLAASAVYERVKRLEERGVIQAYEARLAPKTLGQGLLAFVFVRLETGIARSGAGQQLAAIPGVQEVHHIAGEDCFIVKVRARDTDHLGKLLERDVHAVHGVQSTRSTIALGTVAEHIRLPLDERAIVEVVDA